MPKETNYKIKKISSNTKMNKMKMTIMRVMKRKIHILTKDKMILRSLEIITHLKSVLIKFKLISQAINN